MKNIGIIRRMDTLGRIVIPMEIRKEYSIKENDPIEIFVNENEIILRKHAANCCNCGEYSSDYKKLWGVNICPSCYKKFQPLIENE